MPLVGIMPLVAWPDLRCTSNTSRWWLPGCYNRDIVRLRYTIREETFSQARTFARPLRGNFVLRERPHDDDRRQPRGRPWPIYLWQSHQIPPCRYWPFQTSLQRSFADPTTQPLSRRLRFLFTTYATRRRERLPRCLRADDSTARLGNFANFRFTFKFEHFECRI